MTRLSRMELRALIGAGAVAAGVHAAIAPEHLRDALGIGTTAIEIAGLLLAVHAHPLRTRFPSLLPSGGTR